MIRMTINYSTNVSQQVFDARDIKYLIDCKVPSSGELKGDFTFFDCRFRTVITKSYKDWWLERLKLLKLTFPMCQMVCCAGVDVTGILFGTKHGQRNQKH